MVLADTAVGGGGGGGGGAGRPGPTPDHRPSLISNHQAIRLEGLTPAVQQRQGLIGRREAHGQRAGKVLGIEGM